MSLLFFCLKVPWKVFHWTLYININTTGEIEVFLHILDIYSVCISSMWFLSRKDNGNIMQICCKLILGLQYAWQVIILACDAVEAQKCVWVSAFSWRVVPQACWWTDSISCIFEVKGGTGRERWEFIRVRRWSRSSAWSRDDQWGFPLALAEDCRPQLLRGSLQGDRGFHRCPDHGTLSLNLWWKRARVCTAEVDWFLISIRKQRRISKEYESKH